IKDLYSLKLSDLIKVEIVSNDLSLVQFRQFDELQVHFSDGGKVVFHNLNIYGSHFLQTLENIQPATASVALQRVGRIGYQLQLPQNKLRSYDDAIQKTGFGNVCDSAVDDHAGVEDLVRLATLLFPSEDTPQRSQVQQVTFISTHDQADVGHQQHDHEL